MVDTDYKRCWGCHFSGPGHRLVNGGANNRGDERLRMIPVCVRGCAAALCLSGFVGCGGSESTAEPGTIHDPPQSQPPVSAPHFQPFAIEINTPIQGSVSTVSNALSCAADQTCIVHVSDTFFDETFRADPAPGWHFAGWKRGLCAGSPTVCQVETSSGSTNWTTDAQLADGTPLVHLEPIFIVDRNSDSIELAEQSSYVLADVDVKLDFYRNDAYQCGLTGAYTFMVLNPANQDANDEAPLWVYLHGGGVGHFDDEGHYYAVLNQTAETWNQEESFQDLQNILGTRVLDGMTALKSNSLAQRITEGYRLLVVSMCDHDQYSGLGTRYIHNPDPNAKVNGMQATMSAVDYAVANYPTTAVWAHGTSAGSTGAYNLAISFAAEGVHLTGAVPDSLFPTPRAIPLTAAYGGDPSSPYQRGFDPNAVIEKLGFYGDLSRNAYPEARIAAGFTEVPLLFVGGRNDPFCHHDLPAISEALAEGYDHNCDFFHSGLSRAIESQPNSPHQMAYVTDRGHVPTLDAGPVNDTVNGFIEGILAKDPKAPFRRIKGDNMMLMGHSFFRPIAKELPYHAVRAGIDGHTQTLEFSGGESGAPLALWNDAGHRANIQAVLDTGTVDVFGMTCCDVDRSDEENPVLITEGYKLWFDYALEKNPNTVFFIGIPWSDYPSDYENAQAYADRWYDGYDDAMLPMVDELRAIFPNATVYSIPYGAAAMELRLLFEAGELPDVDALQGPPGSALFTDHKGHAGHILRDLGELIWINAIYGVDLEKYAYNPGYETDLKAIAKSIMDAHSAAHNGPNRR